MQSNKTEPLKLAAAPIKYSGKRINCHNEIDLGMLFKIAFRTLAIITNTPIFMMLMFTVENYMYLRTESEIIKDIKLNSHCRF